MTNLGSISSGISVTPVILCGGSGTRLWIPALLQCFHHAKKSNSPEIVIWGGGSPMREFLYVDDMAAAIFVMGIEGAKFLDKVGPMQSHINIGYGSDISIADLANLISRVVGFNGEILFDLSKPDGMPKKLMDSSLLRSLRWSPRIDLTQGLELAYDDLKSRLSKTLER
jgi:GDP-L-fucose synthase